MAKKMGVVLVSLLVAAGAFASPGGVDRNGCHDSQADGYHCHKQSIDKIKQHYKNETVTQRSIRLKAQCKGLPNAGICFGYSDKQTVKDIAGN